MIALGGTPCTQLHLHQQTSHLDSPLRLYSCWQCRSSAQLRTQCRQWRPRCPGTPRQHKRCRLSPRCRRSGPQDTPGERCSGQSTRFRPDIECTPQPLPCWSTCQVPRGTRCRCYCQRHQRILQPGKELGELNRFHQRMSALWDREGIPPPAPHQSGQEHTALQRTHGGKPRNRQSPAPSM